MRASLEALYIVGGTVIDELLSDWPRYSVEVPGAKAATAAP